MAEHHFVVKYDDNLNHWSVDVESEEVRFPDGTIWDEKTSTWEYSYQGSEKFFTLPMAQPLTTLTKSLASS